MSHLHTMGRGVFSLLLITLLSPAHLSASSWEGLVLPGPAPLLSPSPRPPSTTELDSPPLAPEPPASPPLSHQGRLWVEKILLTGSTVFSEGELSQLTSGYEHREVTAEELQTLRRQLTLLYVGRGLVNSGAVIPEQQVREGVVEIRLVEGRLSAVTIDGHPHLHDQYLRQRLTRGLAVPFSIKTLAENIVALDDGPVIDRIKARVVPGQTLGEARLLVDVLEKDPWEIKVQLANDRSPSVGGERLATEVAHHNLTGWGDTLTVAGGRTEGSRELQASYLRPVNAADTTLTAWFSSIDASVVEPPFRPLDIRSQLTSTGLSLEHPFSKSRDHQWRGGLTVDHRRGQTSLLGGPFSFSPGAVDGEVEVTALRLSGDFSLRQPQRALAFRQLVSLGLPGLGSTTVGPGAEEKFVVSLSQAQWVEGLGLPDQGPELWLKADLQLSEDPLVSVEKMAIGGSNTVRGYRQNLLTRDNAAIVSLELRLPVGHLPLLAPQGVGDGKVELAPFVDWGRGWDSAGAEATAEELMGIGVGLRWHPTARVEAQLSLAKALRQTAIEPGAHDWQDEGIAFRLSWHMP